MLQFQVLSTKDGALPGFVDVLRHMCPPGCQLPQLGTFVLGVTYTKDSAYNSSIEWNVLPADLAAVANSCPGLHFLRLVGVLQPGDARPLLQFSTVQELWLGGQVLDADAAAVVAKMTQLTVLNLDFTRNSHGFGARGFAHLVALTQLQQLGLHGVKVGSISLCGNVLQLALPQKLTSSEQVRRRVVCQVQQQWDKELLLHLSTVRESQQGPCETIRCWLCGAANTNTT